MLINLVVTLPLFASTSVIPIPLIKKIDKHLPEPHVLEGIFKKAGLQERISGWDQFEKDTFYLRVKNFSLETLERRYPMFSKEQMAKLKSQIEQSSKNAESNKSQ